MKLIKHMLFRFACWLCQPNADELDKLAAARDRDMAWSDWAERISRKISK